MTLVRNITSVIFQLRADSLEHCVTHWRGDDMHASIVRSTAGCGSLPGVEGRWEGGSEGEKDGG